MWSLMGCALVRVQPQQLIAGHADKPEMARQRHVTSDESRTTPAVGGGRQEKSAANGAAIGSKNPTDVKAEPCSSSSREANAHLATCSSNSQAPAAQVRGAKRSNAYLTDVTTARPPNFADTLTEQGLTSHQTHYRSYRGRCLQVI